MLRHRFLISFLSTIGFYLVLGFLFFHFSTITVGTQTKPEEHIISFSLSAYEPEVIPPVEEVLEEIIEPEPEPEPIEEVIPEEPVVEEPIIEEVIPEPIVEKIMPKPIPVVKKPIVKKPKKKVIKKKKVKKKRIKKKVVKKRTKKTRKAKKVAKKSTRKQASPARKNAFYAKIRAKIKRNKTYPRIAQRRGMQGSVKVTFTILRNGQVSNIQVSGKKVFYKSARAAIKKAFPISIKNIPVSLPTTVNLTLRYQLK